MRGRPIGITKVTFDAQVEKMVVSVLRSGTIAQGPMVEALERAVASVVGVRHAVAVSNGTASLIAALHVLGVGAGDEVITSPFTFIATLNAILAVGARPRFADIDAHEFTLSPLMVEPLITTRTRVVMPVHLYGQTADMTAIASIAARHGLAIVEDAAQALGATHGGQPAGSFGLGSFSFYATKNVTTGEGGVVTTDDDDIADSLRRFRNQGMHEPHRYEAFGLNLRLTDLQAAVGLPQLDEIDAINECRTRHAAALTAGLTGIAGLTVPTVRAGDRHVFHQYTVRIDPDARRTRDEVQAELAAWGIEAGVYYRALVFDHPYVRAIPSVIIDECPVAAAMTGQVLSLPVHQHLSDEDLARIVHAMRTALT
ncbi:MAG: perosamine synthetase [Acidimicrobiaceae bacterium]|jgi:dTDP-4-amino-4,6-dideoxygalactose transaminase|nr:perosamine synthetase [Acidimicrobiaceae bacterium]